MAKFRKDNNWKGRQRAESSNNNAKAARHVKAVLRGLRGRAPLEPDTGAAHKIMRRTYSTRRKCVYCGATRRLTADHVHPKSRGGADEPGNLVPACIDCNHAKDNATPRQWFTAHPDYALRFASSAKGAHPHLLDMARRIAADWQALKASE